MTVAQFIADLDELVDTVSSSHDVMLFPRCYRPSRRPITYRA